MQTKFLYDTRLLNEYKIKPDIIAIVTDVQHRSLGGCYKYKMVLKMALPILGVLLLLTVSSTEENSLPTILGLEKVGLDEFGEFIDSTGK